MKQFIFKLIFHWIAKVAIDRRTLYSILLTLLTMLAYFFYFKRKGKSKRTLNIYIDPAILPTQVNLFKLVSDPDLNAINFFITRKQFHVDKLVEELKDKTIFTGYIGYIELSRFYAYALIWLRILHPTVELKVNLYTNQSYSYLYFIFALTCKKFGIELNNVEFYDDGSMSYLEMASIKEYLLEKEIDIDLKDAFTDIFEIEYNKVLSHSTLYFIYDLSRWGYEHHGKKNFKYLLDKSNKFFDYGYIPDGLINLIPPFSNYHNKVTFYYILKDKLLDIIKDTGLEIINLHDTQQFDVPNLYNQVDNHPQREVLFRLLSNFQDTSVIDELNSMNCPVVLVLGTCIKYELFSAEFIAEQVDILTRIINKRLDSGIDNINDIVIAFKGHPRGQDVNQSVFEGLKVNFKELNHFIQVPSSLTIELLVNQLKHKVYIEGIFSTSVLVFAYDDHVEIGEIDYYNNSWFKRWIEETNLLN